MDCWDIAGPLEREGAAFDHGADSARAPLHIPRVENIHARVLEEASRPQALSMSAWHTCDTTHCRAGWAVHLAGEAGYALERSHGPLLAGQLIYRESSPSLPVAPARFLDSKDDALADMRAMAAREAALSGGA